MIYNQQDRGVIMQKDKEIVYILTNPAMEGYIKIGHTTKNLSQRLKDLDNTSIPMPFECEFAIEVDDAKQAERLMHEAFDNMRVNPRREFFEMSPTGAIAALRLTGGEEVDLHADESLDASDVEVREKLKRRKPFNFTMLGIVIGSELYFKLDPDIKCIVKGNNKVEFEENETSLSGSAITLLRKKFGYKLTNASGADYWCFDGETLYARRIRLENE